MISYRSGAPIIPVSIKTRGLKYSFFKEVEIIFGKPISPTELGLVSGGNSEYAAATQEIMNLICEQADFASDDSISSLEGEK